MVRIKKVKKVKIILILIISIMVILTVYIRAGSNPLSHNNNGLADDNNIGKKVDVIVCSEKIEKGEVITRDKILLVQRYENYLPANFINKYENVLGKYADVILDKNTMPTNNMLKTKGRAINSEDRISDYEFPGGQVLDSVNEGDFIDIEYVKEDGSTYVVLSKKKVIKKINQKIVIQTTLDERKMINYVMTEKNTNGGKIVVAIYIDESQKASHITYKMPKSLYTKHASETKVASFNSPDQREKIDFESSGGVR